LVLKELVRRSIAVTEVSSIIFGWAVIGGFCYIYFYHALLLLVELSWLLWILQELKRFPTLQSDIAAAANESLERFREDGRKTVLRLVDMEASYLTVEFFRKLPTEPEKAADKNTPVSDRYQDNHLRRIGKFIFLLSYMIACVCWHNYFETYHHWRAEAQD
jgi:hypothetical protein